MTPIVKKRNFNNCELDQPVNEVQACKNIVFGTKEELYICSVYFEPNAMIFSLGTLHSTKTIVRKFSCAHVCIQMFNGWSSKKQQVTNFNL